jgi:3-methyladenine DNA glycosylase AlkD
MARSAARAQEPRQVAQVVKNDLESRADSRRAASSARFFKAPTPVYGVSAGTLRRYAKRLHRSLEAKWTLKQAIQLCAELMRDPYLEVKAVGLLVLSRFGPDFPASLLPRAKSWLAWHCDSWATVDLLAPDILWPLLERHPELEAQVENWTLSPSLWVRRAAAVAFVKPARRGRKLSVAYRIVKRLSQDEEDLVQKACGWLLREAGKTDRARLTHFLLRNGPNLPRTTVRYALEGYPAVDRKHLLVATRG